MADTKSHIRFGFGAGLPNSFLAPLGQVMVQFAFMDTELQKAILKLAKLDINAGVSIFSKVSSTDTRIEILQNLAATKVRGVRRRAKLLTLTDELWRLKKDRNIVAHTLPYSWDAKRNELAYFRETSLTVPQIKPQPPYLATPTTFSELANDLQTAAMWLAMFRQGHPDWNKDALFPWRDKFLGKVRRENQTRRNTQQKRKAQRKSFAAYIRAEARKRRGAQEN